MTSRRLWEGRYWLEARLGARSLGATEAAHGQASSGELPAVEFLWCYHDDNTAAVEAKAFELNLVKPYALGQPLWPDDDNLRESHPDFIRSCSAAFEGR